MQSFVLWLRDTQPWLPILISRSSRRWEQSNWSCLKAKKCSDEDEYCVTNVAAVGIGSLSFWKRITKKCSKTCPYHNFSLGLATYTSFCCQTFLCNLPACPGPRLGMCLSRGELVSCSSIGS
uniref:UPAR/Ly6 domain-containing protein n=1 Tax=Coturnix japonica TaxID=93934 RepID=A0A8C2THM4_COTJA